MQRLGGLSVIELGLHREMTGRGGDGSQVHGGLVELGVQWPVSLRS